MSELGPGSAIRPGSGDGKTSWPWKSESARTNLPGPTLIQVAAAVAGSAPGLAGGLRARLPRRRASRRQGQTNRYPKRKPRQDCWPPEQPHPSGPDRG